MKLLCLLCVVAAPFAARAQPVGSIVASADLDGDGVSDQLVRHGERLQLNGTDVDLGQWRWSPQPWRPDSIRVVDINPDDRYKELQLLVAEGCGLEAETRILSLRNGVVEVFAPEDTCLQNVRIANGALTTTRQSCASIRGRVRVSLITTTYRLERAGLRRVSERRRYAMTLDVCPE